MLASSAACVHRSHRLPPLRLLALAGLGFALACDETAARPLEPFQPPGRSTGQRDGGAEDSDAAASTDDDDGIDPTSPSDGRDEETEHSADAGTKLGFPRADRPTTCIDPIDALVDPPFEVTLWAELYDVDADTLPGLRQQMTDRSPEAMAGNTAWYVSWDYGDHCDASTLTVNLSVDYSMPRWLQPDGVDQDVIDGWSGFIDALWCHEYGHTGYGISVAQETYEVLVQLSDSVSNCSQRYSEGKQLFSEIVNHYRAEEDAYDVETNHGATMGARLPTDRY